MITRSLGKILRGNASPFQLIAACVLGAMIGFAPGFMQAPALWLLLLGALLVVNANIGLALLTAGVSKLLSLLLAPLSYEVGRVMLDGPLTGLARWVVNARVLAWCGLSYYAVSGAQLIGLVIGLAAGIGVHRGIRSFRTKMAAAELVPGKLMKLADNKFSQFGMWLLFGGKGKESWADKAAKRGGNPVRIWGVALVVIALGGGWFSQSTLLPPYARRGMKVGLQAANGATVDVGEVEIDLPGGRFAVNALALADPEKLGTDFLRAGRLEADIDEADLLRRRMHVKKVLIQDASSGLTRETPGELTGKRAPRKKPREPKVPGEGGTWSIEDVIKDAEVWRGRLEQAQEWIDRLGGLPKPDEERAEEEPAEEPEEHETLEEALEREVREKGWFGVQAGHLVAEAPTFRLGELAIENLSAAWMPGKVLDVHGRELSTHPWLIDAPPRLEGATRDGAMGFLLNLAPVSKKGGKGKIQFHWNGLSVDETMKQLKLGEKPPLEGGTLDLETDGGWKRGSLAAVDLELKATFRDTTLTIAGERTKIPELVVPIGLEGPLDDLSIHFDSGRFADALKDAGQGALAGKVRSELEDKVGGKVGKELEKLNLPGDAGGLLDGVLGKPAEKPKKGKKKKADG